MATIYTNIDSNIKRTWILFTVFLIIIIGIGWFLSYYFDSFFILIIAIVFSVFMSFLSYWQSDKIVLAISSAKEVKQENNRELYYLVENLCITAGLPVPRIYLIDDSALNAFATGRNPQKAVIVFTTGLLEKLDRSELEGVIAHELSHIGNRDILLQTVVVVLVGFITLIADIFIRMSIRGKRSSKGGQAQGIIMIIGLVFLILSPIIAKLMQFAISRKREYLADASGSLLTRYPEGLARALEKISKESALKKPNKATAHLFIANPFKKVSKFFSTHPPVEERIKRLRKINI
ncbi:M48 family metallopeptidase [Patescibacteria group bacterium]|nr:M48 family metallopeptidase [Patescibacteria group bacterium]